MTAAPAGQRLTIDDLTAKGLRVHALRRWLGPLVALVLLAIALTLLHRELRAFRLHDVLAAARALPPSQIGIALALTALSYASLCGYDALALAYVHRSLSFQRLAFGSFLTYAMSHTLGFPLITGGSVRYRLWSAWGLTTTEIAAAVGFVGATFTLGLGAGIGGALFFEPGASVPLVRLPADVLRVLGALCLTSVVGYVAWSALRRRPIHIGGWALPVPSLRLALLQVLVAAIDWILAASVFYALLPGGHDLPFLVVFGAFLVAHFAGLLSHVPGGLGVFDALIVLLLAPALSAASTIGALVVYRAVYYVIPFAIGLALLVAYELREQASRHHERLTSAVRLAGRATGRWVPALLPSLLGSATMFAGVVLLASGATPLIPARAAWLDDVLPLAVIELSHFVGSLAGAGLVVLGWALARRLDAAYRLAQMLLAVGVFACLLKGLAWEQALILAVVFVLLLPARRAFYRRSALLHEPFSPELMTALVAVVGITMWLGNFSFKHVEYSHELWWQFTVHGDAPRFLRATVGTLASLAVLGATRLIGHARIRPTPPSPAELEDAAQIALRSPKTVANLALLGDKALLLNESRSAFLMFGIAGRSWVSMGDPIGAPEARSELVWRFRELADAHGAATVFYEVGAESLPLYIELGLTLLKLGEEAIVPLASFSLEGGDRKGLRRTQRDLAKAGATFTVVPPEELPGLLPTLRAISDEWLSHKSTREKGFSLGFFDERYMRHFPAALVRVEDRIVAFANLWLGANRTAISPDLMRHTGDAPHGVMTFLFIELMLWAKAQGYGALDLGMAPLSGLEHRTLAPLWTQAGALIYRHGEHFYNFQGLRQYKEKFAPQWHPKYLASPGGMALPRTLASIATLISGGFIGIVKR